MKKYLSILLYCLFLCNQALFSSEKKSQLVKQNATSIDIIDTLNNDSAKHNKLPEIEEKIRVWTISEITGDIEKSELDTAFINFNQTSTDECYDIANSWLGNMGSPMQSKIFFNRKDESYFIFSHPYANYMQDAKDVQFFDTKTPFSSIAYYRAGPSYGREERLKARFAVSVTPKFSFGFNADYIYGRGMYIAQSTKDVIGNFWMGYRGKKYIFHAVTGLNHFKNYENGGIKNDSVVLYPELQPTRIKAQNMEVNIGAEKKAQTNLQNQYVLFTQKFRTGKSEINTEDSTETFIPIINFIHTAKYEHNQRKYSEDDTTSFYIGQFNRQIILCDSLTRDKVGYHSLSNTLGVELTEDFNKKGKFGLTGYVTHEYTKYQYFADKKFHYTSDNDLVVGGILSKNNGQHFNYNASGDVFVYGERIGEFNLSGNIATNFNVGKKNLELSGRVFFKNATPNRFIQHYESNYFTWDNENFKNEKKLHFDVRFGIPQWHLWLKGGAENITDFIFFNTKAVPEQYDKNIQVASLTLRKDFHVWLLHLENEFTYQKSSHEDALPLPELTTYNNLYFMTTIFKVLTFQIGGELHYHTAYKAQTYNPATGLFYNSDKKIGNYPILNVYANVHLKRVRFFVMYYHSNFNFSDNNYFSTASYPINPGMLKLGLSWNFYD